MSSALLLRKHNHIERRTGVRGEVKTRTSQLKTLGPSVNLPHPRLNNTTLNMYTIYAMIFKNNACLYEVLRRRGHFRHIATVPGLNQYLMGYVTILLMLSAKRGGCQYRFSEYLFLFRRG